MNDHEHRYFIFKTYDSYVLVSTEWADIGGISQTRDDLYEKVEYAVLGCNCGSVIKMKVKEQ